eukprot:augustus_masked-scaffold_6-processed-gene-10.44-mRNA-1 protein AED:1.00 eAED:1.00 QI:0/0/0/0/1/1/2/0/666
MDKVKTLGCNAPLTQILKKSKLDFSLLFEDVDSSIPVRNIEPSRGELLRYLDVDGVAGSVDILACWKNAEPRFPTLAKVARKLLAIQTSSVSSERAFSHEQVEVTKKQIKRMKKQTKKEKKKTDEFRNSVVTGVFRIKEPEKQKADQNGFFSTGEDRYVLHTFFHNGLKRFCEEIRVLIKYCIMFFRLLSDMKFKLAQYSRKSLLRVIRVRELAITLAKHATENTEFLHVANQKNIAKYLGEHIFPIQAQVSKLLQKFVIIYQMQEENEDLVGQGAHKVHLETLLSEIDESCDNFYSFFVQNTGKTAGAKEFKAYQEAKKRSLEIYLKHEEEQDRIRRRLAGEGLLTNLKWENPAFKLNPLRIYLLKNANLAAFWWDLQGGSLTIKMHKDICELLGFYKEKLSFQIGQKFSIDSLFPRLSERKRKVSRKVEYACMLFPRSIEYLCGGGVVDPCSKREPQGKKGFRERMKVYKHCANYLKNPLNLLFMNGGLLYLNKDNKLYQMGAFDVGTDIFWGKGSEIEYCDLVEKTSTASLVDEKREVLPKYSTRKVEYVLKGKKKKEVIATARRFSIVLKDNLDKERPEDRKAFVHYRVQGSYSREIFQTNTDSSICHNLFLAAHEMINEWETVHSEELSGLRMLEGTRRHTNKVKNFVREKFSVESKSMSL